MHSGASARGSVAATEAPRSPVPVWRTALGASVVLVSVGLALYGAWELHRFEGRALTLEGVELPPGDAEPFIRALAADWYDTEVSLEGGSRVLRATRRELGGRLEVDRAVREVERARGDAPVWERAYAMASGRDGRFVFARSVEEERAHELAEQLRRSVALEPVAIRRDGSGGRAGMTLNLMGATQIILHALSTDEVFVSLPVRTIEAPVRPVRIDAFARYTEVLAAFETRYASAADLAGRATNIELSARQLDGRTIAPGTVLSFNEIVGERTFERGFMPAVELARGGRRTEGIGGGICQVAATLHAAAFMAGFDVLEHHPHTRTSSYIEVGLDAMVSWPNRDLRLRNPHEFPVRVRATAYRGRLRVALMGGERAPRVVWSTRALGRTPRGEERLIEPNLPLGSPDEILDAGEDGALIERTRTVVWPDGPVTDVRELRYPVVHRLVRAGPS